MEPRLYFVIKCNEDGEVRVEQMAKTELLKHIEEKYWGDDAEFVGNIPDRDPQSWGNSIVIIKGGIVLPTPVAKVIRYEIL